MLTDYRKECIEYIQKICDEKGFRYKESFNPFEYIIETKFDYWKFIIPKNEVAPKKVMHCPKFRGDWHRQFAGEFSLEEIFTYIEEHERTKRKGEDINFSLTDRVKKLAFSERSYKEVSFDVKDLECLAKLTLLDEELMIKVFKDKECAEILLKAVINRKKLKVLDTQVRDTTMILSGSSQMLDIYATNKRSKNYNFKVQICDMESREDYIRYCKKLLDTKIMMPVYEYNSKPETYVVFITKNDVLGENLPLYHIDCEIQENQECVCDEPHIICVNSKVTDDTELGKLMQDFHCTNAKDINDPVLAKKVKYFKEERTGVEIMCNEMELMREEVREETAKKVREETEKREKEKVIRNMLADHTSHDKIKLYTNATDEEIAKVEKEMLVK